MVVGDAGHEAVDECSSGAMLTETCKGWSDGGDSEHVELQEGKQPSETVSGDEYARGSKNKEGMVARQVCALICCLIGIGKAWVLRS